MNFSEVVKRIIKTYGFATEKEFAKLLGEAPSNFNRKKSQGKLSKLIIDWATTEGHDLNWIFYGLKAEVVTVNSETDHLRATQLLLEVFQSGNPKAIKALVANLEYFSESVKRPNGAQRDASSPVWVEQRIGLRRHADNGPPDGGERRTGGDRRKATSGG